jgi:hypothetical protein
MFLFLLGEGQMSNDEFTGRILWVMNGRYWVVWNRNADRLLRAEAV